VYARRRLLVLAGILLLAWLVVRFWPFGSSDDPVATTTVTAPAPAGSPTAMPSAVPVSATVPVDLDGGGKACDPKDVAMTPAVPEGQPAQSPVAIDIAVTTSGGKPCMLEPKTYDPLAVVQQDDKDVWDSSLCSSALLAAPIQLTPGWATTVRAMWNPRKSGEKCADDEDWVDPGEYTLRIGMLGGEPGSSSFTLTDPPPPPPDPSATPAPDASANPAPQ
jgi:hypothetical protein